MMNKNVRPIKPANAITVQNYQDCTAFQKAGIEFMRSDPLTTNVIGVQLEGVIAGTRPHSLGDVYIPCRRRITL